MIRNRNGEAGCLSLLVCPSGDEVQTLGTEINDSEAKPLASLMEMIRNKTSAKNGLPSKPQRTCNLTRLLAPSIFTSKQSKIFLVAAVSPSSVDTEATLLTMLSSRKYMNGIIRSNMELVNTELGEKATPGENTLILPRQWSRIQLIEWLTKKNLIDIGVGRELSGKIVMNMTKIQLKDYFYCAAEDGDKRANKLFVALRAENDRIARLRVKRKFALQKAKK